MSRTYIDAELMIPGRGAPVRDGAVVLDGSRILYAGPRAGAPGTPSDARVSVPVVLPGLWDCHAHFLGIKALAFENYVTLPVVSVAARAAKDVETALQAGFTSIREAGGHGIHLRKLVEEGTLEGPNIYAPGAILSQTGGHADVHAMPLDFMLDYCQHGGPVGLCDGVVECVKAVRRQLRLGATHIKVCASGGVLSEVDHPLHQQFSDEELKAMVEEAGRAERIVMAHCHGKAGIMAALRAGCRTIEHGSYVDEEVAHAMREANAILVPTRYIIERLLTSKGRIPDYAFQKIERLAARHLEAIEIAHRAGVKIALGTDIATTGSETVVPWGQNGNELALLGRAGLSPLEAIEAATANAPATLGLQAPRSGLLMEGYDADLIALTESPLTDLSIFADPSKLSHVWKAGRLVKAPSENQKR